MKDLNYRFFYYKTNDAYLRDSMNYNIPDDAIIFVEDTGVIITRGKEFGNRVKLDFSALDKESKDALIEDIATGITNSGDTAIVTTENIKEIINNLLEKNDSDSLILKIITEIVEKSGDGAEGSTLINQIVEKIEQSINNGDIDLSGLATKQYVDGIAEELRDNGNVDFNNLSDQLKTALENAVNDLLGKDTNNTLVETILEKIVERDGEGQNSLIEQITQNIFNTQDISAEDKEELANKIAKALSYTTLQGLSDEEKNALANQIISIINRGSGDNGVYTKSEVDRKVEAAQAGTTPEAISNAVNTYMLNNASEVLSNYVTEDDLSDYAKESWVTEQINQHSSGSGSAVPTVNNNTIYFGE